MTVHRPYRGPDDMIRMQRLASELWRRLGPRSSIHIGDLPWRMHQHLHKLSEDRVELWLQGDDVAAAACLAGLHALKRAGADTAVIYSAGASQAFRVYERIGFRSNSRQLQFERPQ